MIQIIYLSRACADRARIDDEVATILAVSRANNARQDITGYLVADAGWFLQVLEGPEGAVLSTYDRIRQDGRHTEIALVGRRPIRARSFSRWSMGVGSTRAALAPVLARHGLGPDFDPRGLTMPRALAMAMDLQDAEAVSRNEEGGPEAALR